MSREESLLELYRKWLEIATFENRVIKERQWDQLNVHVQAKLELMQSIEEVERRAPASQGPAADELRLLIHQLADLEQLNEALVQERTNEVRIQLKDFQQNARKAQQIRTRYDVVGGRPGRFQRSA